jgi:hypothetical protein
MEMQVAELIEQVLALPPADKERVRQALEAEKQVEPSGPIPIALLQQLHAAGLISGIKQPTMTSEVFRSFQPIYSPGKPLSEMIIEDRR